MSRLMQSASALTVAAALAAVPLMAAAQTTESQAEQAVETTAQEVEQGAEQAGEAVEQAAEGAAQEVEEGTEQAGQAVEGEVKEVEVEVQEVEGEAGAATAETQSIEQPGGAVVVEGQAQVEEVEGAITMQDENSILTSELLDATVFNPQGEKVGEIDDAIVSLDGTVEGVVIGVGGFLGIGEKNVAVEMQQLSVQMDANNQPQLIIDTTREALEAAPEFVTAEEQRMEAEQQQAAQQPAGATAPANGGMMTSDPATGMAPAAGGTEMAPAPAEGEPVKQN